MTFYREAAVTSIKELFTQDKPQAGSLLLLRAFRILSRIDLKKRCKLLFTHSDTGIANNETTNLSTLFSD